MRRRRKIACMCLAAGFAGVGIAGDEKSIIDVSSPRFTWHAYPANHNHECTLAGTAVSEMRDDAFEVQFRRARGQALRFYALIPGLAGGGNVYIESPTARDRWRIATDNFVPALEGERAEAIQRNAISGIPIAFEFEFAKGARVKYQTLPTNASVAAIEFARCVEFINRPDNGEKRL